MTAQLFAAEAAFPRGPGFYFSIVKFVVLLAVYLAWVKACAWVNDDANRLRLPTNLWNALLVGSGLCGLLVVWLLPTFWFSILLLIFLILTPAFAYLYERDRRVPDKKKIISAAVWKALNGGATGTDEPVLIRFIEKTRGDKRRKRTRAAVTPDHQAALVLVYNAIFQQASEILLEPSGEEITVRYRIVGDFQAMAPIPRPAGDEILAFLRTLADLGPLGNGETARGRCSAEADGRLVDLSIATAHTDAGERMAIRIIDRARKVPDVAQLGFTEEMLGQVSSLLGLPRGLLVIGSPAGAGKTTTLYSFVGAVPRLQKRVALLDTHIELPLPNTKLVEVEGGEGKNFVAALREVVRGGASILALGELPDCDTATAACQLAQKERLVLAAVPADDAVKALLRLVERGAPPAVVAAAVSAVLGMRLVRQLCPHCKVAYQPNPEVLRRANLPADQVQKFFRPPEGSEAGAGSCEHCGGSGYQGRSGIFELLIVNDPIRKLLREKVAPEFIRREAVKNGMKSMQDDGLRQVVEGKTSVQELLRVCQ